MKEIFLKGFDCFLVILKVKEWWKFYGILIFLAFVSYLKWGGGVEHAGMGFDLVKELLTDSTDSIKTR
jgi:hypothetical protein